MENKKRDSYKAITKLAEEACRILWKDWEDRHKAIWEDIEKNPYNKKEMI